LPTITAFETSDIRFARSPDLDGSDALNPAADGLRHAA
jgi:hypothetical protein